MSCAWARALAKRARKLLLLSKATSPFVVGDTFFHDFWCCLDRQGFPESNWGSPACTFVANLKNALHESRASLYRGLTVTSRHKYSFSTSLEVSLYPFLFMRLTNSLLAFVMFCFLLPASIYVMLSIQPSLVLRVTGSHGSILSNRIFPSIFLLMGPRIHIDSVLENSMVSQFLFYILLKSVILSYYGSFSITIYFTVSAFMLFQTLVTFIGMID